MKCWRPDQSEWRESIRYTISVPSVAGAQCRSTYHSSRGRTHARPHYSAVGHMLAVRPEACEVGRARGEDCEVMDSLQAELSGRALTDRDL